MGYLDDPIWQALAAMQIEPDGAALGFTRRLARENGWSSAFADDVMTEYRRFLYLAATGPGEVTPSQQVDQAWHLHLAYTRHYWGELCGRIIGRPLHHSPTAGGRTESARYRSLYAETLARYHATFGHKPPEAIWPPSDVRFAATFQWVDRSRHFIMPRRPVAVGGAAVAAVSLAACTAIAADAKMPVSGSALNRFFALIVGSDLAFFLFVTGLFVLMVLIVGLIQRRRRRTTRQQHMARHRHAGDEGASAGRRRTSDDSGSSGTGSSLDDDWTTMGTGAGTAGSAAFAAGGGSFGGAGADGSWDSSGSDGGGDSGCGGGCGGGD